MDFFYCFLFLFLVLLFFNSSSSNLLFSSSVSSFLRCTSAREASRFSLRQVIMVVIIKPASEVTDVIAEPINAVTPISLEPCDEGSTSGLFGETVGAIFGFCVPTGVFVGGGTCVGVVGGGRVLALICKFANSTNTPNVENTNKARNIFLAVFKLLPNYGFFLNRTSARFSEQSLDKSISMASDSGRPAWSRSCKVRSPLELSGTVPKKNS